MSKSREFELDKYINNICKKAGVHPNGNFELWEFYSKKEKKNPKLKNHYDPLEICSFKALLKILITQNWDPFLYSPNKIGPTNEIEFLKLIEDFNIKTGIVPISKLIDYIRHVETLGLCSYDLIANIPYARKIYSAMSHFKKAPGHVVICGEEGSGRIELASRLDQLMGGAGNIKGLWCPTRNDDYLISRLFGNVKKGAIYPAFHSRNIEIEKDCQNVVFIDGFQETGKHFQEVVFEFINTGEYYKLGGNNKYVSDKLIILGLDSSFENIYASNTLIKKLDAEVNIKYIFDLLPLRNMRSQIPLIIYYATECFRTDNDFKQEIAFPFLLIHYWLALETWERNHEQLNDEIIEYVSKYMEEFENNPFNYISKPDDFRKAYGIQNNQGGHIDNYYSLLDENRNTFLKLIDIPSNKGFTSFISDKPLEPYEMMEISKLISKPYLFYALRFFDRENNKWSFDPTTIINILNCISSSGLSGYIDLFGDRMLEYTRKPNAVTILPSAQKSSQVEKSGFRLSHFDSIEAYLERDDQGKLWAMKKFALIPKSEEEKPVIINDFVNIGTQEFNLLLFLIYERSEGGQDWLSKILDTSGKYASALEIAKKMLSWCGIEHTDTDEDFWWNNNWNRRWIIREINRKAKEAGISKKDKLIELTTEIVIDKHGKPKKKRIGKKNQSYMLSPDLKANMKLPPKNKN